WDGGAGGGAGGGRAAAACAAPGGEAGAGDGVPGGVPLGAGAGRRASLRDGRRFFARSGSSPAVPGGRGGCRPGAGVALPARAGNGGELADRAAAAQLLRERVRAGGDGAAARGCNGGLQVLPPTGVGSAGAGAGGVEWLRLPDRDELPRLE